MNNPTSPAPRHCEGCGKVLGALEATRWVVCLPCTVARATSFRKRRCACKKADQRPTEVLRTGSRTWISCHRCLAQIKQLS